MPSITSPRRGRCKSNDVGEDCYCSTACSQATLSFTSLHSTELTSLPAGVVNSFSPCPNLLWGTLTPGAVTYIHDLQVMLHSIGCLESVPEPGAVTLHLYSPPVSFSTPSFLQGGM